MLFKKNKIKKNIKEATENENVSDEFESLSSVNQNRFINKFKTKVKTEYSNGIIDVKDKYHRSLSYIKNHWFLFYKIALVLILITTIILGSVALFIPYFAGFPGNVVTQVNNFYLAKYTNGSISYFLTNLGIAFVVLFVFIILMSIFYFVWATKIKKVVEQTNKSNFILSILSYVFIAVAILLIAIPLFIPPQFDINQTDGQVIYSLVQKIRNNGPDSNDPSIGINAIKELYKLLNLSLPASENLMFKDFNDKLTNGVFATSTVFNNYSFIQDVNFFTQSTLSAGGVAFLVLIILFSIAGMVVLPCAIIISKMSVQYKQDHNVKDDWNGFKVFIFNSWKKTILFFKNLWAFIKKPFNKIEKTRKEKNKHSFKEYKKQLKENNVDSNNKEKFNTDKVNNTVKNVITLEEIEKHQPNKAFLNSQGQWMYHDGQGKVFTVKNDEWIPFDINASVHISQVNVNNTNDTNMSQKTIKESKIFKNSKMFDSLAAKTKKEALIDLPDEELDKIINELDI